MAIISISRGFKFKGGTDMKKWIPTINCGLLAGETPMAFEASDIDYFDSEEECEEWIIDNAGNFTIDELAGCIYPQEYEE